MTPEIALHPKFGDIIENGWASEDNPTRVGFFVREGRRTGKMNPGRYFEVTDGKGKFWVLPVDREHKITVRSAISAAREEAQSSGVTTAWLIEWPDEDLQTRWWHPVRGWTVHADHAIRYARKEDAEATISTARFCAGVVATEHKWIAP